MKKLTYKVGKPTRYTNKLNKLALKYTEVYESEYDHAIPSISGLSKVLSVPRSDLYFWSESGKGDFTRIFELIKIEQEITLISKGLKGTYNSTITKLLLCKHGYSDKQETEITGANGADLVPTYQEIDLKVDSYEKAQQLVDDDIRRSRRPKAVKGGS